MVRVRWEVPTPSATHSSCSLMGSVQQDEIFFKGAFIFSCFFSNMLLWDISTAHKVKHIRLVHVNGLNYESNIFFDDSNSWFEESKRLIMIWRLVKDLDQPEFWSYGHLKEPKIENKASKNIVLSSFRPWTKIAESYGQDKSH